MTLCWLTNGMLVFFTAEHWSPVYQSINVVLKTPSVKIFLHVSARVFCSVCVLPHVYFQACASMYVLPRDMHITCYE